MGGVWIMGSWTKITNGTSSGSGSSTVSKWNGKLWTVIGDSNTEANGKAALKYHDILKAKTGCTVQNLGKSGSGWWNSWTDTSTGTVNKAYYKRLTDINPNSDLITILGGGNDYAQTEKPLVLGVFGDTDPDASFYGALDYTLKTLIATFPTKTIAVFTQFRRYLNYAPIVTDDTLESLVEAEKKVSAKYGIPCLDLYHNANQYPWLDSYKTSHMPDGVHLNDLGQQKLASKMLPFLESL
jgi:lysophospholipase L1-like esterase